MKNPMLEDYIPEKVRYELVSVATWHLKNSVECVIVEKTVMGNGVILRFAYDVQVYIVINTSQRG